MSLSIGEVSLKCPFFTCVCSCHVVIFSRRVWRYSKNAIPPLQTSHLKDTSILLQTGWECRQNEWNLVWWYRAEQAVKHPWRNNLLAYVSKHERKEQLFVHTSKKGGSSNHQVPRRHVNQQVRACNHFILNLMHQSFWYRCREIHTCKISEASSWLIDTLQTRVWPKPFGHLHWLSPTRTGKEEMRQKYFRGLFRSLCD